MKHIYSKVLLIALTIFGLKARAQCTGCTTTIAGSDASNHFVGSGQKLCVSSTGTVTGLISVASGGALCNEGLIQSTNLLVAGGTLMNYGTINTTSVAVTSGGTFDNNGTFQSNNFLVTNSGSHYMNHMYHNTQALENSDNALFENFAGNMFVADLLDSNATFINQGGITVTNNMGIAYTGTLTNNGGITITNTLVISYTSTCNNIGLGYIQTKDFYGSYNSTVTSSAYFSVSQDFYNSTNATFNTSCVINVGRDWYNSTGASILSPNLSTCGGFAVTGGSYNTGNIGTASCHVDICDAGHPALGLDGPGGTIASTTTYCSCNSSSCPVVGVKEFNKVSNILISSIFPNPAIDKITVKLNSMDSQNLLIEIRDMMGRIVLNKSANSNVGENEMELNVSSLPHGTYILSITDSHKLQSKKMFQVSK